jgi:hypothetical protein
VYDRVSERERERNFFSSFTVSLNMNNFSLSLCFSLSVTESDRKNKNYYSVMWMMKNCLHMRIYIYLYIFIYQEWQTFRHYLLIYHYNVEMRLSCSLYMHINIFVMSKAFFSLSVPHVCGWLWVFLQCLNSCFAFKWLFYFSIFLVKWL